MNIKAFKMDGLGNDFIIIDLRHGVINLSKEQIIKICDRKFLGCDQLVLINKSVKPTIITNRNTLSKIS